MDKKQNDKNGYSVQMSQNEKVTQGRLIRDFERKKKTVIFGFCIVVVALILGAVLSCTIFFPVENVEVVNVNPDMKKVSEFYDKDKIIDVAGVEIGKNLLLTDIKSVSQRITTLLPYIGNAVVTRKLPDTVLIAVEDFPAEFAVKYGAGYVLFNRNGKVLDNKAVKIPDNCTKITGVEIKSADSGKNIVFNDESKYTKLFELYNGFKKYKIENVTKINLTSIINIKFVCENKVTFVLGSTAELDSKLKMAAETYKAELEKGIKNPVTVDVSIEKKAYVRPDTKEEELEKTTVAVPVTVPVTEPVSVTESTDDDYGEYDENDEYYEDDAEYEDDYDEYDDEEYYDYEE